MGPALRARTGSGRAICSQRERTASPATRTDSSISSIRCVRFGCRPRPARCAPPGPRPKAADAEHGLGARAACALAEHGLGGDDRARRRSRARPVDQQQPVVVGVPRSARAAPGAEGTRGVVGHVERRAASPPARRRCAVGALAGGEQVPKSAPAPGEPQRPAAAHQASRRRFQDPRHVAAAGEHGGEGLLSRRVAARGGRSASSELTCRWRRRAA